MLALAVALAAQAASPTGPGESFAVSRSVSLPGEIGFAFIPYGECLSDNRRKLLDDSAEAFNDPSKIDSVRAACVHERDEAMIVAATTLEQIGSMTIEQRTKMIVETASSLEALLLRDVSISAEPSAQND